MNSFERSKTSSSDAEREDLGLVLQIKDRGWETTFKIGEDGIKVICPKCGRPAKIFHLYFEASTCQGPLGETKENYGIDSPSHFNNLEGCGELIEKEELLIDLKTVINKTTELVEGVYQNEEDCPHE